MTTAAAGPDPALDEVEQRVAAEIEATFAARQVPWLRELVEMPSHTAARDDVEVAAAKVDALAAEVGLERTLFADPSGRFTAHRVYVSPGLDDAPALALVGHVDTVHPRAAGFLHFAALPAATTVDAGEPALAGERVHGPGVLDMKSGLSAMLFALLAIRRAAPQRFAQLPLRVVCNTDEEVGSPTSAALFRELAPKTRAALVFEAGRLRDEIVTCRKGGGHWVVRVFGRAAHAGNDHAAGINAIHGLALLIPRLEALTDASVGTSVNVGLVGGGTAKNTVPDEAWCEIDARFVTMADAQRVSDAVQKLVAHPFGDVAPVPSRLAQLRFEIAGGVTRPPMEASDANRRLMQAYGACARAFGLGADEAPLQGGGSDANLLAAHGVPVIDGLGPYGRFFHNPQEWASLASLRAKTKALACFLLRWS